MLFYWLNARTFYLLQNFEDEVESWQPLVDRLNDVGNELIREFPEHNPSDIRLTSHRDTQRYNKLASR